MSHHGREGEDRVTDQEYSEVCIINHNLRRIIGSYLQGLTTSDELRNFAIASGIIADPDAAVKSAHSKMDRLEKELKVAKAAWMKAMQTRKCNGNE
jgi:hypothetical protein